jgi:hypothetical protein
MNKQSRHGYILPQDIDRRCLHSSRVPAISAANLKQGEDSKKPDTTGKMAETQSDEYKNKEIVREGFARWANGTGSFFDLLADDVEWTITGSSPISKTYTSRKQFLEKAIAPINE